MARCFGASICAPVDAARAFDEALGEVSPTARRVDPVRHGRSGSVYPYRTAEDSRWRFVYRRSDGTQTSKRGFAREWAARDARRRLIEHVERGELRHKGELCGLLAALAGLEETKSRAWHMERV